MKSSLLAFVFAFLVVLSGVSIRQNVAGIGGTPIPLPPKAKVSNALGIGGTPIPLPPKAANAAFGIGGTPIPLPPK